MEITRIEFEKAIEKAYRMGSADSLANLMTPQEIKRRVRTAILEGYNLIKTKGESSCTLQKN